MVYRVFCTEILAVFFLMLNSVNESYVIDRSHINKNRLWIYYNGSIFYCGLLSKQKKNRVVFCNKHKDLFNDTSIMRFFIVSSALTYARLQLIIN